MVSVSHRYAKALFEVAPSKGELLKDLRLLQDFFGRNQVLKKKLMIPVVELNKRFNHLDTVLKTISLENPMDPLINRFCRLLIKNRRFNLLNSIVGLYHSFYEQFAHIRHIHIIGAQNLEPYNESIQSVIQNYFKDDRLDFSYSVDPKLLGGIMIKAGNFQIDYSLKFRLNQLSHSMKGQ
jgi:F-type H+-transporting ATPase subunit delta